MNFLNTNLQISNDTFLQLSCLNVIQKLRGKVIPGYMSLFEQIERNDVDGRKRSKSLSSLDRLILEEMTTYEERKRERRDRNISSN